MSFFVLRWLSCITFFFLSLCGGMGVKISTLTSQAAQLWILNFCSCQHNPVGRLISTKAGRRPEDFALMSNARSQAGSRRFWPSDAASAKLLPNHSHLLSTYFDFGTALSICHVLSLLNPCYICEIGLLRDEETQAHCLKTYTRSHSSLAAEWGFFCGSLIQCLPSTAQSMKLCPKWN